MKHSPARLTEFSQALVTGQCNAVSTRPPRITGIPRRFRSGTRPIHINKHPLSLLTPIAMQLPPPTPPNTPAHTPAQLSTPTPSSGGSPFGHGIAPAHGVASTPNAHASGAAAAVPATPNNAGATPTAHQVNRLESDPFVLRKSFLLILLRVNRLLIVIGSL